ncbi:MAG: nuclear transport factor 2 family protein [Rhodothermales bacterium]
MTRHLSAVRLLYLPIIGLCLLTTLLAANTAGAQATTDDEKAVSLVLDALHQAASDADGDRYFSLYAENAIFLGTDASERWTLEEFKAYANPYFDQGRGWTYLMESRYIYLSSDKNTAWFDEILSNANFGTCRGSGVLIKIGDTWKVAQYHLTLPVPNSLIRQVAEMISQDTQ